MGVGVSVGVSVRVGVRVGVGGSVQILFSLYTKRFPEIRGECCRKTKLFHEILGRYYEIDYLCTKLNIE